MPVSKETAVENDKRRVVVAGSMNADTILQVVDLPAPGQTVLATAVRQQPGGKSSNQAASAALLGAAVELYGVVGTDAPGDVLVDEARSRGVDVTGVRRAADLPTGSAVVMVDGHGENSIVVSPGANAALAPDVVPAAALDGAPIVVLALESPVEAVTAIAAAARERGCDVLLNASPADAVPDALLRATSVLVVNEGEISALTGIDPADAGWDGIRSALGGWGIRRAIVTRGAHGAVVIDDEGVVPLPALPVEARDTTGCGDAFMGAVAADLADGRTLSQAARTGIAAGAWAAERIGAQSSYGTRADLASRGAPAASTPR